MRCRDRMDRDVYRSRRRSAALKATPGWAAESRLRCWQRSRYTASCRLLQVFRQAYCPPPLSHWYKRRYIPCIPAPPRCRLYSNLPMWSCWKARSTLPPPPVPSGPLWGMYCSFHTLPHRKGSEPAAPRLPRVYSRRTSPLS